ncbi:MAG: phosphoribosylformylglycinamidine synthase subunit PurQ [Desulfobacterales bacterium]|jgi:phosphoribosylformylglycinamidine synthase
MTGKIRALVLTGFGLNCDLETAYALELAGAQAVRVHINALIDGSARLEDYQILALGGGFSWGDDHGAGVLQAVRLRTNIGDQLRAFVEGQRLVIGICNGFQTLVNLGLLPGLGGDYQARTVALTFNDCGNFRDDWVTLKTDPQTSCVFTEGLDILDLPIRHGEGKFTAAPEILEQLAHNHQIVMRYAKPDGTPADGAFPANPNGSVGDIAGICDPTGRVFGLMPHPEAYNHWTNHPLWTRQAHIQVRRGAAPFPEGPTPGIQIFQNAVACLRG